MRHESSNPSNLALGCGVTTVIAVVVIFLVFVLAQSFLGYWGEQVSGTEIGVIVRASSGDDSDDSIRIVGPGIYTDILDMGANLYRVDQSGYNFQVIETSVALAGPEQKNINQIIGLTVAGTVFRPGLIENSGVSAMTPQLWRENNLIYLHEDKLQIKVEELTRQAIKVCIGPRTLTSATVGTERNDTANCIDEVLTEIAKPFALRFQGITVPDVTIPDAAATGVAELNIQQIQAQAAISGATKDAAEAERNAAAAANAVDIAFAPTQQVLVAAVTQAYLQGAAISAEGTAQALQATNDYAQLEFERAESEIELKIAEITAQASTAQTAQLAELYQKYPEYAAVIIYTAYAKGLESVEKVFYIPPDTQSLNMINGTLYNQNGNIVPIIPMNVPGITATPVPGQ